MTRIALALLIYASLASAQPWQWELTNPNWKNPTNFPHLSPEEFPVCVADINGDGLTDVLQFGIHIYPSILGADGNWTEVPTSGGPEFSSTYNVTAQNLDSNPAQELVFVPTTPDSLIRCFKLDTTEQTWEWIERADLIDGRIPELLTYVHSMIWGNFDQDEYEEVAILMQTIFFEEALFIYQRTSSGEPWTSQYELVFSGLWPQHIYAGDFDHDGDSDIAVAVNGIDDFDGTLFFENAEDGIQYRDMDSELRGPGGGDFDGDGQWEYLYLNSCVVPPMINLDGPFVLETSDFFAYTFGQNLRDVAQVVGRLRESEGSYVAGATSFFCFSPWGGPNTSHTDILDLTTVDRHPLWSFNAIPYDRFSIGDINNDGLPDMLGMYNAYFGTGWSEPVWNVLLNIGSELHDEFEQQSGIDFVVDGRDFTSDFGNPYLGDVDGDGRAELILYALNSIFPNTIEIFRIEQLIPTEILPRAYDLENGLPDSISTYEVTDLDGDGLAEILLVENGLRAAYFFRNGQWDRYDNVLPNITSYIRGFADWDNNGTMDIFTDAGIYLNMSPSAADDPVVAPSSFKLSSYPNPFNAQTTITFDLPRAGDVTLTLFDVLGQEIETLLNEQITAGTHTLNYDAARLPSGVYFTTLKSGDVSTTHKLLLLK